MTYFTPSTHYVLHCLLCKFTATSYFIAAAIFNLDLSLLHSPWGNPSWLTLIRVRSTCKKKNQQVSVNLFHDMEEGTIFWLLTVNIAVTGCFTCYSVLYPSVCLPLLSVCLSVCCLSVFHVCLCLSVCLPILPSVNQVVDQSCLKGCEQFMLVMFFALVLKLSWKQ